MDGLHIQKQINRLPSVYDETTGHSKEVIPTGLSKSDFWE